MEKDEKKEDDEVVPPFVELLPFMIEGLLRSPLEWLLLWWSCEGEDIASSCWMCNESNFHISGTPNGGCSLLLSLEKL